METVDVHEAKAHLSRLLKRVERGERIAITRDGTPIAVLARVEDERPLRRTPGSDRGRIWMSDDFDEPLPEFDGVEPHPDDPLRDQ